MDGEGRTNNDEEDEYALEPCSSANFQVVDLPIDLNALQDLSLEGEGVTGEWPRLDDGGGLGSPPDMESPWPAGPIEPMATPYNPTVFATAVAPRVPVQPVYGPRQPTAARVQRQPPTPAPPPGPPLTLPEPLLDAAAAGRRFGLDKLGQSAGTKVPCPVMTWVAGIVYCIAIDDEISGSDDSLTGMTLSPTHLGDFKGKVNVNGDGEPKNLVPARDYWREACIAAGGTGFETGLKLRLGAELKGPKGDLICRIAERAMVRMGKKVKGGMFKDWEALRKHLCDDKSLETAGNGERIEHFSYLWTGPYRGGNKGRDFSQTYYERRYTPELETFDDEKRSQDRKAGGGGNPGLFAHCGFLLQKDFPGLYEKAKEDALADIANGLQVRSFRERRRQQEQRYSVRAAMVRPAESKSQKSWQKRFKRIEAEPRKAEQYIRDAASVLQHPAFQRWAASHPEAIARSYLASQQFTTVEIERIEVLFRTQSGRFTVKDVKGVIAGQGLGEFRKILAGSPATVAPSPPTVSSAPSLPAAAVEVAADLGISMEEAASTSSSASSTGSLTRRRSLTSEVDDDEHRLKRSTLTKMSSKGPGLTPAPSTEQR